MGPIVCGSTGNDSIKVFRISLGLHESFTASVGAAGEIVQRGISSIQCSDDGFCLNACFVHRPVAEINQLFRMSDGPGRTTASAVVTVVRGSGCVTAAQRIYHASIGNAAGPTTISLLKILSIPACCRKPDGKLDFGITRRP